ncbi:MAG: photosynthetic reaction center cytochrome c subunit, partial [Lewinella sp.]|nr:photosynthetic reaction center cytochrome c subunit [Lewinella sp.]
ASEEKPTKQITRDMMKMTRQINDELLNSIENLGGEDGKATVNCTTCHRGQVVPALRME